jgi:hypothetical protein
MKKSLGKSVFGVLSILAVCAMFLAFQPAQKKLRIGTYDSRAIVVAYVQSEFGAREMRDLTDKYNKAKAEGNEKLAKELETQGPTKHQAQMVQCFSTASVANILENVKSDLPKVAKEAGVDLIVSQWDLIYKDSSAEVVDVTLGLVKLFNPKEAAFKTIEELRKQPPIPLEVLLPQLGKE